MSEQYSYIEVDQIKSQWTGATAFSAPINMTGNQIHNLGLPSSASDAATKAYVDSATYGETALVGDALIVGYIPVVQNSVTLDTASSVNPATLNQPLTVNGAISAPSGTISGTLNVGTLVAAAINATSFSGTDTMSFPDVTATNTLTSQGALNVTGTSTLGAVNAASIGTSTVVASTSVSSPSITSTGALSGATLNISGTATTGALSPSSISTTGTVGTGALTSTSVTTPTVSATTSITSPSINATTTLSGAALNIGGTATTGALTAASISTTGTASTGALTSTSITTTGTASTGALTATAATINGNLSVTGSANTGALTAASISSPTITATTTLSGPSLTSTSSGVSTSQPVTINYPTSANPTPLTLTGDATTRTFIKLVNTDVNTYATIIQFGGTGSNTWSLGNDSTNNKTDDFTMYCGSSGSQVTRWTNNLIQLNNPTTITGTSATEGASTLTVNGTTSATTGNVFPCVINGSASASRVVQVISNNQTGGASLSSATFYGAYSTAAGAKYFEVGNDSTASGTDNWYVRSNSSTFIVLTIDPSGNAIFLGNLTSPALILNSLSSMPSASAFWYNSSTDSTHAYFGSNKLALQSDLTTDSNVANATLVMYTGTSGNRESVTGSVSCPATLQISGSNVPQQIILNGNATNPAISVQMTPFSGTKNSITMGGTYTWSLNTDRGNTGLNQASIFSGTAANDVQIWTPTGSTFNYAVTLPYINIPLQGSTTNPGGSTTLYSGSDGNLYWNGSSISSANGFVDQSYTISSTTQPTTAAISVPFRMTVSGKNATLSWPTTTGSSGSGTTSFKFALAGNFNSAYLPTLSQPYWQCFVVNGGLVTSGTANYVTGNIFFLFSTGSSWAGVSGLQAGYITWSTA